MVAIVPSGVHFSDPHEFDRSEFLATKLSISDASDSSSVSTTATFFTNAALAGLADDTNWTANTYKTLLSVTLSSGVGLVSALVGPTGLAGTPTTTFEITVDGVLYTVPVLATTTGHRAVLGAVAPSQSVFTSAFSAGVLPSSIDATKTVQTVTSQIGAIPSWATMRMLGTPCLKFTTSLLVRAKSSESNSTTTNKERQSAVLYRVLS